MQKIDVLSITLLGVSLWAQPGPGRVAIQSPEVSTDGHVTFRLRAPAASEVSVTGLGDRLAMQKNDQGVWSVTTANALKPDIYTYSFSVDGATVTDPANPLLKTSYGSGGQSLLHVPGDGVWEPKDGPRGSVTHHFYKSALIGDNRDYYVYTPPNYDPKRKEPYPVLFLLHGLGDEASSWLNVGAANVILDNLIDEGKAKPMIMVNTLGYGTPDGPRGAMGATMIPTFAKALVEEVMPRVEKEYHVSKNREDRAIAGLSMGGAESIYTAFNHLDHFAWIGSFSGAFVMWPRANPAPPVRAPGGGRGPRTMETADFEKNLPKVSEAANSHIRLLWIACGADDGLKTVNEQLESWLKSRGVQFTGLEIPGYAHVWPLWRQNLAELAPMLFQSKGDGK